MYKDRRYYILTALSVLAIAIVMLSPGNGIRMTHQLSAHPYLWTVVISLGQSFSWLFFWGPLLFIATLVYIPLYGVKLAQLEIFNVSFLRFAIAFVVTVVLAHVPPALGLSSVVIDRTANSLLTFVIPAYFYGVNILIHKYPEFAGKISNVISHRYLLGITLFGFLFIGPFSISSPVATAVTDILTGKADRYASIQEQRIRIARSAGPGQVIELPPLGLTSRSLYVKELDPVTDGEFSVNFCKIYGCKGQVFVEEGSFMFEDNFMSLKNFNKDVREEY